MVSVDLAARAIAVLFTSDPHRNRVLVRGAVGDSGQDRRGKALEVGGVAWKGVHILLQQINAVLPGRSQVWGCAIDQKLVKA